MKVSLYIRVSTGRQANEGDSLEEQEKELKKFCEYKNYLIHKIHIERGRSAKDTNRPEYQKLLTDIKEKKINAVIVKKLDRLSRSLLDFEEFMRIAQEYNVEFISLKENFDTTNAMGKAMLRVALVFAQLEREQTSERISDVLQYRATQGLYNGGNKPFGYDLINGELVVNKQEKRIIEYIFKRFMETKSTSAVAKDVNAQGFRTKQGTLWDARKIDKVLRRPVYLGKIQWNKKLYDSNHQALITKSVFNMVQDIFANQKYFRGTSKIGGILKGFLYCGYCNSPLTSNYTKKKNGQKYFYYRCTSSHTNNKFKKIKCKSKYHSMKELEQKVYASILSNGSEEKLNAIKRTFIENNKKVQTELLNCQKRLDAFKQRLMTVKEKKELYLDSLISNSLKNNERTVINEKISEFSIEEKQLSTNLYQLEFEISNKEDQLQNIEDFKEQIIFFKINYQSMSNKELLEWFRKNINHIIYTNDDILIDFKLLKISS